MSTPLLSSTVTESSTDGYLAAVEAALADLPIAERSELLDDVRQHLAEVAAETGQDLTATLGSPETYAAELRSAAGLAPAATSPTAPTRTPSDLWSSLMSLPVTRAALRFLPSLRPGWWVLRGIVVSTSLLILIGAGGDGTRLTEPHPGFYALLVIGAVLFGAGSALLGSLQGGRNRKWQLLAVAANLGIAVLSFYGVVQVREDIRIYLYLHEVSGPVRTVIQPAPALTPGSLTGPNGLIYNIFPDDSNGQPLSGVQLFDQNHNPINIEVGQDPNGVPLTRQVPVSADGHALDNVFPQTQLVSGGSPAPARSPVAAIPSGATAVVPPGPGSPQPVILPNSTAVLPQATPVPTK